MEQSPGVYRLESFTDVDLVNLAEIARKEDYKSLAQWILSHKDRELVARTNRHLERRKTEYGELRGQLVETFHKYAGPSPVGFRRIIRDISDLNTVADRMLDLLDDDEIDKEGARALISRDNFRRLVKLLAAAAPRNPPEEVVEDYVRRLRVDHVFLLEELIHILTVEYDKRVLESRRRFEEYLTPHQRIVESVRREITEIDGDLARLESDASLLVDEREKIRRAFGAKRVELRDLERIEGFKLRKIEFLCLNLRDSVEQFRGLIGSLQSRLDSYKSRQSYVEKLARLGARVPEFRQLLESLYETFQRDLAGLQKSFLVFDRSFQELVLSTVDSEKVMSRIVLAPPRVVGVEMEIVNPAAGEPTQEEDSEPTEAAQIDLSFLRSYGTD